MCWSIRRRHRRKAISLRDSALRLATNGAEGDGIAALLDGGDAVFPPAAGFTVHQIQRARFGVESEALPFVAKTAAEAEPAGAAERQSEHLVEMRLVAMPADADADVVIGAKDLPHASRRQPAESLDLLRDGPEPVRDRLARLQL